MTSDLSAPPVPAGAAPRPPGVDATYLDLLADLQARFLDAARRTDPEARVPWCGRWRVRHLVVHLARIHHWAAAQAARTREVPLGRGPFVLDELYDGCARELRETLGALDPDATTSTLVGPGPVAFWHRRQVHETLVHLWDLRTAAGVPAPSPAALWADTVDELVTVMQPRQVRLGRMAPLPVRVRVEAEDVARAWTFEAAPEVSTEPDVVVAGPAEQLALLLWRRRGADDGGVRVQGSREALDHMLAERTTP
ncbi:maleylpyruvate isomerase family mycothiol-dependent enzyme [Cellulomonas sp. JZ18]|uniref:maleylpyruvate isomerase family mycothiol-dependent enzyme n=1 Tax=Cellulomonas sp. JZ18 TaxID=2654191 RepID=UPI0012D37407|nr:maleylpyruvate isomerase family mycothiol-dependent enzyme [Cellulomonas sp. JZ18]QGQ19009.1 maleylpyruvate isomerase family mycothiol-dependent enzyme [Cellulomonas sp. JZ18]